MTKGGLLKLLEMEIVEYRLGAIDSLKRNTHMHNCKNIKASQVFIDALLVDFVNNIATGQGVDLGLYTHYISGQK
jgi:hypothetical protein